MKLENIAQTLLGAVFGVRVFDDSKPLWARAGYGIVAFDLLRTGLSGIERPGASLADGTVTVKRPGLSKPLTFAHQRVRTIQERVALVHKQMLAGTKDPKIYALARQVLTRKVGDDWAIGEKDHWGEATALFNEVRSRVRYTWDPTDYDAFQTPARTLELHAGDCVPATSLVLTAGYKLKPIGEVREGDLVMGDGQWTKVTKFWDKGEKRLLEFTLNNGCVLRCTPEHKLFVVPKGKNRSGRREDAVEKRARDVKLSDDLLTPAQLPMGLESIESEKAWLLGTFIADGWTEDYRCAIAGKDGHPKEMQKKRVQAWCEANGIATRWHERYIAINDAPLTNWLSAVGKGAKNKHVPSLDLDEPTLRAVLSGLEADSGLAKSGSRVYSTISEELALQLRVMFRMLGQSVSITKVNDHGGLGTNPIFRVTVRKNEQKRPFARVKVIREAPAERVVDIETDTHRFWLPESDVVVHNCDDMTSLLGALLRSVGHQVRSRIVQTKGATQWNHIYLVVKIGNQWKPLDASVAKPAGWEVPPEMVIAKKDFDVVEG